MTITHVSHIAQFLGASLTPDGRTAVLGVSQPSGARKQLAFPAEASADLLEMCIQILHLYDAQREAGTKRTMFVANGVSCHQATDADGVNLALALQGHQMHFRLEMSLARDLHDFLGAALGRMTTPPDATRN